MTTSALRTLIDSLVADDAEMLAALFDGDADIDLPETGRQIGRSAASTAVAAYRNLVGNRDVTITLINEISTADRTVVETSLALADLPNPLTLALVAEHSDAGLLRVRGYHAMQHYKGRYTARPQLIDLPAKRPAVPEVVARYFDAVHHHPDLEQALAVYADDGYLVAPTGNRAEGPDALRFIYSLFLESGGIALHHCAAIDDGHSIAIEWVCDRWGPTCFPISKPGARCTTTPTASCGRCASTTTSIHPSTPPVDAS